jgi:hypothetical protein
MIIGFTARFARNAESAERFILSFVAERTTNENTQPLRGKVFLMSNQLTIHETDKLPAGLRIFCFLASLPCGMLAL